MLSALATLLHEHVSASIMVFKFESRAEATALLRRRSRDAAVALLNKEFTAQRWTLRKELKLSVRPLVTLRYFRRAVGAVRAPTPGARELCAGGAVLVVAYAVALVARGAVGARAARHAARALAAASYCLWWFVCGVLSCVEIKILRRVRARTAFSSPRNDLVKNCRVHPKRWLIPHRRAPIYSCPDTNVLERSRSSAPTCPNRALRSSCATREQSPAPR